MLDAAPGASVFFVWGLICCAAAVAAMCCGVTLALSVEACGSAAALNEIKGRGQLGYCSNEPFNGGPPLSRSRQTTLDIFKHGVMLLNSSAS